MDKECGKMKLKYTKICGNNEGVSEVVGGLLLITIVVSFMTSLLWISNSYIDMQKNVVTANMELIQDFIENISFLFPTPGDTAPVASYPDPEDGETGVPLNPVCSVMVYDSDTPKLFVTFFFYGPLSSPEGVQPTEFSFSVDNNTRVECPDPLAKAPDNQYSWEVSVSDGTQIFKTPRYYFRTAAADPANHPPEIHAPIWPNEVAGVGYNPLAYLWVSDSDGDIVTVSFHLMDPVCGCGYEEGSVSMDLSAASAKFSCYLTHAIVCDVDYQWSVTVTDGHNVVQGGPYKFTTVACPSSGPD